MGLESILQITSTVASFTAITLMLLNFYLTITKKILFKSNIKLIKVITYLCLVKMILSFLAVSLLGVIIWSTSTFIWFMFDEGVRGIERNRLQGVETIK